MSPRWLATKKVLPRARTSGSVSPLTGSASPPGVGWPISGSRRGWSCIGRLPSMRESFIEREVVAHHALRAPLLERARAAAAAIEAKPLDLPQANRQLLLVGANVAGHAVLDDLRHR